MKMKPFVFFMLSLTILCSESPLLGQVMTVTQQKPLALVTIVDNSGSMDWDNRDPENIRFKGMEFLIGRLQDQEAFSYVSFDTNADIVIPITEVTNSNRTRLVQDAYRIPGDRDWTNYTDGFIKGLQVSLEAKERGFFPVVLFLTDGELNVSAIDEEDLDELEKLVKDVIPQFLKEGIPIFTIGLGDFKKEILINISDAAKLFENSNQFYEVVDGSEIPFVMNDILSVIRGEETYQSYSISSGKSETTFEISPNTRKMSVELTSLDEYIDVSIYDPEGNALTTKPEESFAFLKWVVENPKSGTWRVVIDSTTASKIAISLEQEYSVELLVDRYIPIGNTSEALVKLTKTDQTLIVPGKKLSVDGKELDVKTIKGFLTVQGAGIDTIVDLKWDGSNLVGTVPKVSKAGILKIYGEVLIECGDKKDSVTVELAVPQKTARVISAEIVKLEASPSKGAVRNSEVIVSAKAENAVLDSVEVQIFFPDGRTEVHKFTRDSDSLFKVAFVPPIEGKYMVYPVPTEDFVFSSASREIVVQEPYMTLKRKELVIRGAFPNRDYWVDTPMITEFYVPDDPKVVITADENDAFLIETPGNVTLMPEKSETSLKFLVSLEERFSSVDKILRKRREGLVTISDVSGTLKPSEESIAIRVIAPLPAVEVAIASAIVALIFMIPALARKKRQIPAGRILKLDELNETTFGRASDVRYRFEQSNFPLHGFTIFHAKPEEENDPFSTGEEWVIKSDDAAGTIFVDEYPLAIGESARLNDGSRISVRKGRKNLFAFSFETREDQAVLHVRSTKYRLNKAAVASTLFSIICTLTILWWTIIQKFGI